MWLWLQYADGRHKIWDTFMELIEPYASRVPYQIAVGNHEYDWKTGLEKKHKHHTKDASGRDDPYDPNWGNYGTHFFPSNTFRHACIKHLCVAS